MQSFLTQCHRCKGMDTWPGRTRPHQVLRDGQGDPRLGRVQGWKGSKGGRGAQGAFRTHGAWRRGEGGRGHHVRKAWAHSARVSVALLHSSEACGPAGWCTSRRTSSTPSWALAPEHPPRRSSFGRSGRSRDRDPRRRPLCPVPSKPMRGLWGSWKEHE